MVKNLLIKAGDTRDVGLIPGLDRSPGVENGNPLQYSCLGRGTWQAVVYGIAKSQTLWSARTPTHTHTHTHTHENTNFWGIVMVVY